MTEFVLTKNIPIRLLKYCGIYSLLLLTAPCLSAEQPNLYTMPLNELLNLKVRVASKTEEKRLSAPSSVTTISRSQIKLLGIHNFYDLLNFVPGYQATNESRNVQNAPALHIRGVNRGDFASHVMILLDGVRLNGEFSGNARTASHLLSTDGIDHIEIIRGPGSALYGGNAFLGIINIITQKNQSHINAYIGNMNSQGVNGRFSIEKETYSFSTFFGHRSSEGDRFTVTSRSREVAITDPWKASEIFSHLDTGNLSLSFFYNRFQVEDYLLFYTDGENINKSNTHSLGSRAQYDWRVDEKLEFRMSGSFSKWESNTIASAVKAGENLGSGNLLYDFIGGPFEVSQQINMQLESEIQVPGNQTLVTGIEWRKGGAEEYRVNANYANTTNPEPINYLGTVQRFDTGYSQEADGVYRTTKSFYLQDKIEFNPALTGFFGVRHDTESMGTRSTNPRASLVWSASKNQTWRVQYGSAYRAPSLFETKLSSPITIANPNLRPEQIKTSELAYSWLSNKNSLEIVVFHNKFDMVVEEEIVFDRSITYVNANEFSNAGIEFEWQNEISSRLRNSINYTSIFDNAENTSFREFGTFTIIWTQSRFSMSLDGIYRGEIEAFDAQPSYWILGGSARYQLKPTLSLSVTIRNLADEEYGTYGQGFEENRFYLPQRGREFSMGLEFEW